MSTCNRPVTTVNSSVKPCLCVAGHAGGCNPFSPNPYMAATIAKNESPKRAAMPLPTTRVGGVIWTDKSTTRRCLWQGANGRCIYELGNHTQHQEENTHVVETRVS